MYEEIKKQSEEKMSQLFKDCRVFFAFSNQQFDEGKTSLEEGEKYVRLPHGGFCPKFQVEKLIKGMEDLKAWEKKEIKKHKEGVNEVILYHLNNFECFYTGDPSEAWEQVKHLTTKKQFYKVYQENQNKWALSQ